MNLDRHSLWTAWGSEMVTFLRNRCSVEHKSTVCKVCSVLRCRVFLLLVQSLGCLGHWKYGNIMLEMTLLVFDRCFLIFVINVLWLWLMFDFRCACLHPPALLPLADGVIIVCWLISEVTGHLRLCGVHRPDDAALWTQVRAMKNVVEHLWCLLFLLQRNHCFKISFVFMCFFYFSTE